MKTISRAEYLQLLGLAALAARHDAQLREIEATAREVLGDPDDASGHISDMIYGSRSLRELPALLGIDVEGGIPA